MRRVRSTLALLGILTAASACTEDPGLDAGPRDAGADDAGALPERPHVCDVARHVFVPTCSRCHFYGGQEPELTWRAAQATLVGAESPTGGPYVTPGNPGASFLYRKIAGTHSANLGERMPPGEILEPAILDFVARWIQQGAETTCPPGEVEPMEPPRPAHPPGFAAPEVHGPEMGLGLLDCRTCHGAQLTGADGPSCDGCHQPNWRTDCTYCHGGTANPTGAPPRDVSGETALEALTFRAHTPHVTASNHAPYACTQCHTQPVDALSPGHIYDDTPGRAEVRFGGGLSRQGRYEGSGRCSNLYCHGNGNGQLGEWDHTRGKPACDGCHPAANSGQQGWVTMSGRHARHLGAGVTCEGCHAMTARGNDAIRTPAVHADGQKTVDFQQQGVTRNGNTCSGTCHGHLHGARPWN